jgi:hypothetical protein
MSLLSLLTTGAKGVKNAVVGIAKFGAREFFSSKGGVHGGGGEEDHHLLEHPIQHVRDPHDASSLIGQEESPYGKIAVQIEVNNDIMNELITALNKQREAIESLAKMGLTTAGASSDDGGIMDKIKDLASILLPTGAAVAVGATIEGAEVAKNQAIATNRDYEDDINRGDRDTALKNLVKYYSELGPLTGDDHFSESDITKQVDEDLAKAGFAPKPQEPEEPEKQDVPVATIRRYGHRRRKEKEQVAQKITFSADDIKFTGESFTFNGKPMNFGGAAPSVEPITMQLQQGAEPVEKEQGGGSIIGRIGSAVGSFLSAINPISSAQASPSAEYSGGTVEPRDIDAHETTNAKEVMDYFMSRGWSKEVAAGIAGNIYQESKFDTKAKNGSHIGLIQWDEDRQREFQDKIKKPVEKASVKEQLDFVQYELTQGHFKKAGAALATALTPEQAAVTFLNQYEISGEQPGSLGYDVRVRSARSYYAKIEPAAMVNQTPTTGQNLNTASTTSEINDAIQNRHLVQQGGTDQPISQQQPGAPAVSADITGVTDVPLSRRAIPAI